MSGLGPPGPNSSGLNFSQAAIRRNTGFSAPHPNQNNKPSPAPHNASPYQSHPYTSQQATPTQYNQQLFTQSQMNGNVPNGASRNHGSHVTVPNGLGARPRPPPPRQQMQTQSNPPPMIFPGSMNQHVQHESLLSHPQQQHTSHQAHPGHQGHQAHQTHSQHTPHQPHQNSPHPGHHTQQQQQQQQQQQHQSQHHHHQAQTQPQSHQPPPNTQQQQQPQHHTQHAQPQPQPQHPQHPQHQQQQQHHTQHPHHQQQQQQQYHAQQQQQQQQQLQQPQHPQQVQPPQQQPAKGTPQQQHRQTPQQQQAQAQAQPQPQQSKQQQKQQGHSTPVPPPQGSQQLAQPSGSIAIQRQRSQASRTPQQQPESLQQRQQNGKQTVDIEMDGQEGEEEPSTLDSKMLQDPNYINDGQPLGEMMSPPPEGGSYPTLEAVQKAVLRYCMSVGYAIVIGRSKKTVPGLKKVLFVCDRAGKPPSRVSPEFRKRKTSSRKCDCPFGFFAIEQRTQWTIRYRPDHTHLRHNHGPSDSPSHHPAARKLDSKMVAAVKQLKDDGAGVSETLQILQTENPDCHLLPRDIYNARAAINRNPTKVASGIADNKPAIYTKPNQSSEDRIRADLRRELAKAKEDLKKIEDEKQKEIDELKAKMAEKDEQIQKFEMFIDICNQRVMVQRERLSGSEGAVAAGRGLP